MAAARLIDNKTIIDLIQKQTIYKYDIDSQQYHSIEAIQRLENNCDVLCDIDQFESGSKIVDLLDNCYPIIEENKKKDILIHLNSLRNPLMKKKIPRRQLKNYKDVANSLISLINSPLDHQQYSIDIQISQEGMTVVILLPETGGA